MLSLAALLACRPAAEPDAGAPDPVHTGTPPADDPLVVFDGAPPRHVLMLSLDTLRVDHVVPEHMPWLSWWLEGAVWLRDHQQCSSWTYASTVCTLNGVNNEENGFLPKLSVDTRQPVPEGQETLAVHLQRAGFSTYLVSGNEWLSDVWNNAQGYEHVEPPVGHTITNLGRTGRDLVKASGAERWFLHLHGVEPHVPYNPPADYLQGIPEVPWDVASQPAHYEATALWPELTDEEQAELEANLRARYAADVRFLDDQLKGLWADLQADGLLDDTLVVVWTDHGEQFWERGQQSHAWQLAAEENDGLLAFWWPGVEAVAHDGPTHAVDLVPTLLSALELPPPARTSGVVVGTEDRRRTRFAAVSARQGVVQTVTRDGWKLQFNWNGNLKLWHRAADRRELGDLAASEPDKVAELWVQLEPHVRLLEPLVPERSLTWPSLR